MTRICAVNSGTSICAHSNGATAACQHAYLSCVAMKQNAVLCAWQVGIAAGRVGDWQTGHTGANGL